MRKQTALHRLFQMLAGHRLAMTLSLLFTAAGSFCGVLSTLYIGKAIDLVGDTDPTSWQQLIRVLIVLLLLYLLAVCTSWLGVILANRVAYRSTRDLRCRALDKLGRLPLSYYDTNVHGDIISRFTNDIDNVGDALSIGITGLCSAFVVVTSTLIMMLRLNARIAFIILIITPLCFLVAYIITHFTQSTFKQQQEIIGELTGFISEIVGNQKTIQALGYQKESTYTFKEINSRLFVAGKNAQFASSLINPTTRFLDHLSYVLVGVIGGFAAISGHVSVGIVSSFLIYSAQFAKPFNELSGIMTNLQTAFASLHRTISFLDAEEEIPDSPQAQELSALKGAVAFEKAAFSYDKKRPLIEDLSLVVQPGNLVAIVGPTGAGKTTIVNLLMRFYELDEGAIYIDHHNIAQLTRDSLRRGFGMVLQDTWLFAGTVRDNIAYGCPHASEEEIIAAAKAAHAHSFIMQLRNGYDTVLSEDAGNLSQGQKQLLTIARVMLQAPPMLILDEATSSIDTLTEQRVSKAFLRLMKGRTSFVIAHRLSTIVSADAILVLDQGKVIEIGTHKSLLQANGFYSKLYHSQFES